MDSLSALVSWQIWKERNTRCFKNGLTTISDFLSSKLRPTGGSRRERLACVGW
jgi:hypothetical protein